jgi:hypothetical protein
MTVRDAVQAVLAESGVIQSTTCKVVTQLWLHQDSNQQSPELGPWSKPPPEVYVNKDQNIQADRKPKSTQRRKGKKERVRAVCPMRQRPKAQDSVPDQDQRWGNMTLGRRNSSEDPNLPWKGSSCV